MACTTLMSYTLTNNLILPRTAGKTQSSRAETVTFRAIHFEKLIQCFGQGYPPSVQMPSVLALSELYQCEILSLLGSLKQLRQHAYEYRMNSLDLPLVLLDPLSRFRCRKSLLLRQRKQLALKKGAQSVQPEQATDRD